MAAGRDSRRISDSDESGLVPLDHLRLAYWAFQVSGYDPATTESSELVSKLALDLHKRYGKFGVLPLVRHYAKLQARRLIGRYEHRQASQRAGTSFVSLDDAAYQFNEPTPTTSVTVACEEYEYRARMELAVTDDARLRPSERLAILDILHGRGAERYSRRLSAGQRRRVATVMRDLLGLDVEPATAPDSEIGE